MIKTPYKYPNTYVLTSTRADAELPVMFISGYDALLQRLNKKYPTLRKELECNLQRDVGCEGYVRIDSIKVYAGLEHLVEISYSKGQYVYNLLGANVKQLMTYKQHKGSDNLTRTMTTLRQVLVPKPTHVTVYQKMNEITAMADRHKYSAFTEEQQAMQRILDFCPTTQKASIRDAIVNNLDKQIEMLGVTASQAAKDKLVKANRIRRGWSEFSASSTVLVLDRPDMDMFWVHPKSPWRGNGLGRGFPRPIPFPKEHLSDTLRGHIGALKLVEDMHLLEGVGFRLTRGLYEVCLPEEDYLTFVVVAREMGIEVIT